MSRVEMGWHSTLDTCKKPEGGKTHMSSIARVLHSGRHGYLVTKVGYEGGVRRRFCPSFNRVAELRATRLKGVNI